MGKALLLEVGRGGFALEAPRYARLSATIHTRMHYSRRVRYNSILRRQSVSASARGVSLPGAITSNSRAL
jgi:hypothetical protein